jgi:hypothetical protein
MNCSECKDLRRTFERTLASYVEALSAAFYRVGAEIAARKHVALVRAENDLQEHQLVCPWAIASGFLCRQQLARIPEA